MQYEKKITGKKLNFLSHSQIKSAQCLRRYYHIDVIKDLEIDYKPFVVGKAIHEVIYEYTLTCQKEAIQGGDYDLLDDIIKSICKKMDISMEDQVEVRRMCLNFAETEIDFENVLGAEYHFDIEIDKDNEGRPIRFKGVIDRVDATVFGEKVILKIVDYKSQRNVQSAGEVDSDLQFRIYRYAAIYHVWKHYSYVQCGLYHLQYGFMRWGLEEYKGDLWNEFQSIEDYIKLYWEKISTALKNDDFPPERGPHCWDYDGCPVLLAGACPAWSQKEIDAQGSVIEKSVRNTRLKGFEVKQARKTLQDYFREREPRLIDDQLVGYEMKKTFRFPAVKVIEWAVANNVLEHLDPTFTESVVQKFLKKARKEVRLTDEQVDELMSLAVDEMSKTFHV